MKFDPYGAYIKCHVNILTFNMYELFTIKMLYSLKKIVIFTPLPPHNGLFLLFSRSPALWIGSTVSKDPKHSNGF